MKKLFLQIDKIKIFIIILFFLSSFSNVYAGEVFFEAKEEAYLNQEIPVSVKIKTDKVPINTIEMSVVFDNEKLIFTGYEEKNSLISFWINRPKVENNKIKFSGVSFGGVSEIYEAGKNNIDEIPVVSLKFKTKKEGVANFSFDSSLILKNDGLGSSFDHLQRDFSLEILKENFENKEGKQEIKEENILDNTNAFEIIFVEKSVLGENPNMLVFNYVGGSSGVKEFKIKKNFSNWVAVENPYPVSKGIFSKNVLVRAYDYGGSFQEASVLVPGVFPSFYLIIVLGVFLALFCVYKLLK